jgi:hypothetical protein
MIDRTQWIAAIRSHACKNYRHGGWDYLVECWSDAEIIEEMGEAKTLKGAIRNVGRSLKIMDDYRRDIVASGEW